MLRELRPVDKPEKFIERINPLFIDKVFPWKREDTRYNPFQCLPLGWREIDTNTYHRRLLGYSLTAVMHVQFMSDYEGNRLDRTIAAHLYLYWDGTGIACEYYYKNQDDCGPRFYAFGCDHDYREVYPSECKARGINHYGNCWHVYECEDCGHIKSEDSSG